MQKSLHFQQGFLRFENGIDWNQMIAIMKEIRENP